MWLGRFEEKVAAPILTPLIKGELRKLSSEEKVVVARWVALRSAVIDALDPATSAVDQEHRTWLREHDRPPERWLIWITQPQGPVWSRTWNHRSYTFRSDSSVSFTDKPDIQTTTFGFGHLAAHVFSAKSDPPVSFYSRLLNGIPMLCVWPDDGSTVTWPRLRITPDAELAYLSNALRGFSR